MLVKTLKEYLKLWDKRFCFTILDGFFSEQYDRIIYLEMIPGRGLVVEPKAKANHNFSYNKIDLSKNDKNTYKDYYTINDILTLLKTKRGCLISDQCIEYFNNPTINTKNNLLEYEAQHENALITLQSYIRKYNAESLVLNYPNSIIKIQSYIRKRACYHQFIQLKQIKTYQKIKACQTMQNHIRRLIAEDNFHNEINKLKLIETQQKINAIITIQKYLRKVQAEILLETLNHHDSFVKHLDLISTNRYQHNLCKRAKLYQRIKILIYANAGLVITFFALYKIIQRLIND